MLYLPILIYLYGSLVGGKEFTPGKGVLGVHKAVVRSGEQLGAACDGGVVVWP